MKINLYIERLVVEGVEIPAGQRHLLKTGIQTELLSVLSAAGLKHQPAQNFQADRIQVEPIRLNSQFDVKDFCFEVASSLSGGIFHE
ncbi:MAG: hypothetical protein CTY21_11975 [Methylomonas sp.]|nr:MAG: hypothetical protein CTY21_11975 [Methylomonas sp.]